MEQSRGETIDPLARSAAIAIACARIAIGVGTFAFTRPALAALGFSRPGEPTVALARLAGGRDIALGVHALATVNDRNQLRQATALGAAVDLGDAIAFGVGLGGGEQMRRTALKNAPLGALAALAGAWISGRL